MVYFRQTYVIIKVNHCADGFGTDQPQVIVQESKDLKEIIARLNERLNEPFVTAGTVTGDKGIKTCAKRSQTSSLDLLRRCQVYPTRRRTSTSAS